MTGLELKIERVRHRVRQAHVAALLGKTATWLCDIEAGRHLATEEVVRAVLKAIQLASEGKSAALVPLERTDPSNSARQQ